MLAYQRLSRTARKSSCAACSSTEIPIRAWKDVIGVVEGRRPSYNFLASTRQPAPAAAHRRHRRRLRAVGRHRERASSRPTSCSRRSTSPARPPASRPTPRCPRRKPARRREVSVRVHATEPRSRANGPGARFVVWMQGCTLGCPGCFNPATHDARGGREVDGRRRSPRSSPRRRRAASRACRSRAASRCSSPTRRVALLDAARALGLSTLAFSGYTHRRDSRAAARPRGPRAPRRPDRRPLRLDASASRPACAARRTSASSC